MNKISYSTLNLQGDTEIRKININNNEIEVKQYLSVSDKYDLVMITLQQSYEDGIYNPLKLDMFFELNLVFLYTNIDFSDEDKKDLLNLYDILNLNGIIDLVIDAIPQDEYDTLINYVEATSEALIKYSNSFTGNLNTLTSSLAQNIEEIMNLLNNFDKDKFKDVTNFARAIGADV